MYTEMPITTPVRGNDLASATPSLPVTTQNSKPAEANTDYEVDAGQAYISQLLLNVYSSPGRLKLWIDQFEMRDP